MIRAGLLLAAGSSRRFGPANKLTSELEGRPLVEHAAAALRASGLSPLVAVVRGDALAGMPDGFRRVDVGDAHVEQSRSLRAGVAALDDADSLTVVLGDMPRVTADLIRDVTAQCPAGGASAATGPMPPACFSRPLFPRLLSLEGDRGAGALLRKLPELHVVEAGPDILVDVDRPEDLESLRSNSG